MHRRFRHSRVAWIARVAGACLLAGGCIALGTGGAVGAASTGSSVVGATVPSSIALDQSGCSASASRDFGVVTAGSSVLTSQCTIQFQSSNDSSMLRMVSRARDATQPAMKRADWAFTVQRAATGTDLYDIDAVSADVAWAVGAAGDLLFTSNAGSTWTPQVSGTAQILRRVDAVDASTAWIVGDGGTVLRTVDAGVNWDPAGPVTVANLRDVHAVDADEAWIAGNGGTIFHTRDGGTSWTTVSTSITGNITGISAPSQTVVVAATDSPREIWRSTDAGATWAMVSTGGTCQWRSLDEASPTVLYVSGCNNNLGVSTDAGATWTIRTDGWTEGDDTEAISPQVAYFGDTGGGIDRTYDGLATLPFHPNSTGVFIGRVTGLAVPSVDQVWFVGDTGVIARSDPAPGVTDYAGGANWASGGTTSMFGVCVEAIGATTIPVWAADTTGVSATCEASDTDTWRAVPDTPTKIAEAGVGDVGSIDLVWGLRASSSQAPGTYFAPVEWEAVAPAV